jgi:hypothetical protein
MKRDYGFSTLTLRRFAIRLFLLLLASYGLLYFSYKWSPGDVDFRGTYAEMYKRPLDLGASDVAHVLRQGSAIVTYLLYKAGAYYPSQVTFIDPHIDQRLFFAALLANYLGLAFAAALAGSIVEQEGGDGVVPLLAGLLCILSFGAQNFVLTGSTDGVTWALVALIYFLMVRDNRWLLAAVLFLSIFQREMIVVAFAALSAVSLFLKRPPNNARYVLVTSLICFGLYVLIRILVSPVDTSQQLQISHLAESAWSFRPSMTLLLQGFVSQNLILICMVLMGILRFEGKPGVSMVPPLFATFAVIAAIAILEGELAGDVGNVSGMLTPLFAAAAAAGISRLEERPASA